jgi:tRNA(Ile)-lysidine synthase
MRLIRGSGVDGLAGIRSARSDGVIRPLIDCERRQVLAYLEERGISYADDCTNRDRRLLRNRVRHEILPVIRAINPGLHRTLARTAQLAATDADLLEQLTTTATAEVTGYDGTIKLSSLDALPDGMRGRVLRSWLKERRGSLRGIGSVHLGALIGLAHGAGPARRWEVPGNGVVVREYGTLRFSFEAAPREQTFRHQLVDGSTFELGCGWQVNAALRPGPYLPPAERSLWHFWADAETVGTGLTMRNALPGDRIRPLGLGGHRKLQDVFVDCKVPRDQRWSRPVLEAEGVVLWVPGLVRSHDALISPQTRAAWRVVIEPLPVAGA